MYKMSFLVRGILFVSMVIATYISFLLLSPSRVNAFVYQGFATVRSTGTSTNWLLNNSYNMEMFGSSGYGPIFQSLKICKGVYPTCSLTIYNVPTNFGYFLSQNVYPYYGPLNTYLYAPGSFYYYACINNNFAGNCIYFPFSISGTNVTTDIPAQTIITNNITATTTWNYYPVYVITGNITINSGVTLTIASSTVVKFSTTTPSSLTVNGTLNVNGELNYQDSLRQVFFTSMHDDLVRGDTNNNGTSTSPTAGDWGGVIVNSGGRANIKYTTIRYGGNATSSYAQIYNNGGIVNISSSTVSNGYTYGIKNSAGTTTVQYSDIGLNSYGIYKDGGSVSITSSSTIHDNTAYGVYNNTTNVISATGNYWGDSSGPFNLNSNSSGTGNSVTDYVNFYPWIGTSTLHFVTKEINSWCLPNYCNSVINGGIVSTSSTIYSSLLVDSINTWNNLNNVVFTTATSTYYNLNITDISRSDIVWKGQWFPPDYSPANTIQLNTYYLSHNTSQQIQNTITHELGHALGLYHSFTSNIMYPYQSDLTTLGQQDLADYYYLWP